MKILVIQLARFGDIYQTWPVLRGIKRVYASSEIHVLGRKRFEKAWVGLESVDRKWALETAEILSPILSDEPDLNACVDQMKEFVGLLRKEKFDIVINLTFSPFSSYLTRAIAAGLNCQVFGYSRHSDGTLAIMDETSKFFFGQVGVDRFNRVHLCDIYSTLVGIPYVENDWLPAQIAFSDIELPQSYIVIHVGASESHKSFSAEGWGYVIDALLRESSWLNVVMIGAKNEAILADVILKNSNGDRLFNLVGKTEIYDLFPILQNAQLLVGADSAPLHVASLTNTTTLNLSVGQVNFWETGPKANPSYIFRVSELGEKTFKQVVSIIARILQEGEIPKELILRSNALESYMSTQPCLGEFQWKLIKAIYFGELFPVLNDMDLREVIKSTYETNEILLARITKLNSNADELGMGLIEQAQIILMKLAGVSSELKPLFWWLEAEKVSIGPGTWLEIVQKTFDVHRRFRQLLTPYLLPEEIEVLNGSL